MRKAGIVFAIVMTIGGTGLAQPADESPSEPYLRQLVEEVRLLRLSLQRSTLSAYRGQLMIERLRLHQETVASLTASIDRIREERTNTQAQIEQIQSYVDQVNERAEGEFDPERLRSVESERRMIEQRLEMLESRLAQLDLEESDKTVELQREREAVDDVRRRLDEIDREIERRIEESEESEGRNER